VTIHSFEAVLIKPEGVGTWIYLNIPIQVSITFNSRGQVKVKGAINGYPFRTTALPMGDGSHYLVVGKGIRDQISASQGDTVKVLLEVDLDERQVDVPEDLLQALACSPQAEAGYNKLSYSQKKLYVDWILGARQAQTRQRRIEKAIMLLSQGKKWLG
jgi:hypothetical protein